MDYYHIWADLKDLTKDLEFAENLTHYLNHLQSKNMIVGHHLARRKLGLGLESLGEFHIVIETENLAQLERAFDAAKTRTGEVQRLHAAVYSAVTNVKTALYRDFPDR